MGINSKGKMYAEKAYVQSCPKSPPMAISNGLQ